MHEVIEHYIGQIMDGSSKPKWIEPEQKLNELSYDEIKHKEFFKEFGDRFNFMDAGIRMPQVSAIAAGIEDVFMERMRTHD